MKITKVEVTKFTIKSRMGTIKWSSGSAGKTENILVRIHTDDGITGGAEVPARPTIYGDSQESLAVAINEFLGPAILGVDPFDLERIWDILDKVLASNLCAKGAIDMALYDIMGRATGLPVYKILGGWDGQKVPVSWMISLGSPEKVAKEARKAVDQGFKTLKIKGGIVPKDDLEVFKAVRKAVGEDICLYIDANQGWKPDEAIWVINKMQEWGLAWVEEPVPVWDIRGRTKVAKAISVPILGDESVFTPEDVKRELDLGIIGIISIKTPRTGFTKSRKILHMAEAANIPCLIGSQGETGLGTAASAHFGSAFKNVSLTSEISLMHFWEGDLLKGEVVIENGYVHVPQGPGLGVEIDEKKLRKYRVT